jgi:DNA-binding transcriptional ArsR family regulator
MDTFKILEPQELGAMASPFRQQLLESLATPDSASGLARRYEMSRQRIGYHMRDLERAGCIEITGERQHRGLKEKLYRTRPMVYAFAPPSDEQRQRQDQFSWAALVDLVARTLWDLMSLRRKADAQGKRLATLAIEADLYFETPAQRKAFTESLIDAVEDVVRDHEQPKSETARAFRLVIGAFPKPAKKEPDHDHPKH